MAHRLALAPFLGPINALAPFAPRTCPVLARDVQPGRRPERRRRARVRAGTDNRRLQLVHVDRDQREPFLPSETSETFSPPIHLCADSRGRSLDPGLRLPEQGLRDSVAHFLCRSTTRSRRSVSRPTGPEQRQRVSAVSRLTLAPRSPRSSPGFAQLRTPGRV